MYLVKTYACKLAKKKNIFSATFIAIGDRSISYSRQSLLRAIWRDFCCHHLDRFPSPRLSWHRVHSSGIRFVFFLFVSFLSLCFSPFFIFGLSLSVSIVGSRSLLSFLFALVFSHIFRQKKWIVRSPACTWPARYTEFSRWKDFWIFCARTIFLYFLLVEIVRSFQCSKI